MAANTESLQLIARLTPLKDVLALIAAEVGPVTPRTVDLDAASGRTLAADVTAPARPSTPIALADGWALAADLTLGAGGYAPVTLPRVPSRVETGQAMPPGTDSVASFDAVKADNGHAEVLASVNPGDGMLPAGGDCDPGIPLRRVGE
jgi:molybdopterin biosynthesis enzyme